MKSHKKNVLIYHIGFVTLEDLSCSNINSIRLSIHQKGKLLSINQKGKLKKVIEISIWH